MKLLIKISSVAFLLFFAISVFAINGNPGFTIKNVGEKVLNFDAKGMTSKHFEIRIQDQNGATLFSEYSVNPDAFERNYNLSELPPGLYFLLLEDDSKTQIIPILIEPDGLKIDLKKMETIEKAIVG